MTKEDFRKILNLEEFIDIIKDDIFQFLFNKFKDLILSKIKIKNEN